MKSVQKTLFWQGWGSDPRMLKHTSLEREKASCLTDWATLLSFSKQGKEREMDNQDFIYEINIFLIFFLNFIQCFWSILFCRTLQNVISKEGITLYSYWKEFVKFFCYNLLLNELQVFLYLSLIVKYMKKGQNLCFDLTLETCLRHPKPFLSAIFVFLLRSQVFTTR